MTQAVQQQGGSSSRGGSGNLYDILELILDRGLVIDVFVRVSLVGIELVTIDVRVVVASVDTYLRFAEACNRLDLVHNTKAETLPEFLGDVTETGAKSKTKGALSGAKESITGAFQGSGSSEQSKQRSSRSRKQEEESE